jgi:hypothetical protein
LIYAPIQDLLVREDLSVIDIFKRFKVLSVRYEAAQTPEPWDGRLSSDFTFLGEISSARPWDLANSLTDKYLELFLTLRDEEYPNLDCVSSIVKRWTRLRNDVKECVLAHRSLADKLAKTERVGA